MTHSPLAVLVPLVGAAAGFLLFAGGYGLFRQGTMYSSGEAVLADGLTALFIAGPVGALAGALLGILAARRGLIEGSGGRAVLALVAAAVAYFGARFFDYL